ncbi:MAG: CHAT domain-containing tetratricopeptide repeat protein [Bacteroidota bacterium]
MSVFRNTLFLYLLFSGFCVYAQPDLKAKYDAIISSEVDNASKLKLVESLINESNTYDPGDLANVYYDFSKWNFNRNKDEKRAKHYAKKEFLLRTTKLSEDKDPIQRNLYNLGLMYRYSKPPDYDNAIAYFDTLISISKGDEIRLGNAYRVRGDIYDALGDFQRALENYSYSENIFKGRDRPDLQLKTLINVSGTYAYLSDQNYLDSFMENKEKIEALQNMTMSNKQAAMLQLNTGAMFNTTSNFQMAYGPTKKALALFEEIGDSVNIFKSLSLIGVLQNKDEHFSEASKTFASAMKFAGGNRLLESSVANNLGDMYLGAGDYQQALSHYNAAILVVLGDESMKSALHLPVFEDISLSPFKKRIFAYLNDLANCWLLYFEHTGDTGHLLQAEKTISLADQVVDALFFESREEISKLSWREKASQLYIKGVTVAFRLEKPEAALYFMEKNKGLLLLENINNVKARQDAKIPIATVEREHKLLNSIKTLQLSLAKNNINNSTSLQRDSLKNQIFSLKRDYSVFIDSLETSYPSYVKFKKELEIESVESIRQKLAENERVVAYALGDSLGYALLLTRDKLELKQLPIPVAELNIEVEVFRDYLLKPFTTKGDALEFQLASTQLFEWLFPFDNFELMMEEARLIIIPDGMLQSIPFDALTYSSDLNLSNAYVLSKCEVLYKYSLSIGSRINLLLPTKGNSPVGFLLNQFSNDYEIPLSGSLKEADAIKPFYGKHIFSDTLASKQSFLEQFDVNSLIHISTHGGISDSGPWLAFYDEHLLLDELYFLKNQKELVVLSACKTSAGEYKKGEGTFSIARGFIKAGVKSVLSTLWDVNEKASFEIISAFYENMETGDRKSEALRDSKLGYLQRHQNTSEASPYYWSGFTITGDNEPIDAFSNSRWGGIVTTLLIGLTVLAGFMFFRRKRTKAQIT